MILSELRQPVAASVRASAQEIHRRHGSSLVACLFYGSCLRDGRDEDRVIDFYAIADDYRRFHESRLSAALNAILPPNVYYLETPFEDRVVRAKYAVVSLAHLIRQTSPAAFQERFSAPRPPNERGCFVMRFAMADAWCPPTGFSNGGEKVESTNPIFFDETTGICS